MKKRILIILGFCLSLCIVFVGFGLFSEPQGEVSEDPYLEEYTLYNDRPEDYVPPCIVLPSKITRLSDNAVISVEMEIGKELSDFFCSREYLEPFCKCMPEYHFENGYGAFSFNLSEKYARNETGQITLNDAQISRIKSLIGQ